MEGNSPYITNLVNSIIGVGVLAMPFCLKQCGIILGLGLLFCSAWLTYLSCSMLAHSAFHKRRRTYEYLAFYTLGPAGKFTVELSMIGMMLGSCIAFYIVIGDLSNGILLKFIDGADPHTLRTFTIVFCALCIALPLGLMKNLAILSYFGFFSLLFYLVFVVVVMLNAVSNGLLRWEWWGEVTLFRLSGLFQCLPIFSLAYACQCQLFIVYNSLEDPSVRRIEDIVSGAIKFVTVVYMSVGFFGYTTYRESTSGNLLVSFPPNLFLDFIKLGFAMSIVLGFPLMISPCRQSIHTLFFAKPAGEGLQPNTYIPPFLFKSITLTIVLSTMIIAIVTPNVETILGLTGATMGSIISFIFPALIYEKAAPKATGAIPKFVFCLGCLLLVVCTYSNLAKTSQPTELAVDPKLPVLQVPDIDIGEIDKETGNIELENKGEGKKKEPDETEDKDKPEFAQIVDNDYRQEPAIPIEADDDAGADGDVKKSNDINKQEDDANVVAPDLHQDPGNKGSPEQDLKVPLADPKEEEKKEAPEIDPQRPDPQIPDQDRVVAKDSPPLNEQKADDPARRVPENQQNVSPKQNEEPKLPADDAPQHPPGDRISPKIIKKDSEVLPREEIPRAQIERRLQKLDDAELPGQKDVPNADAIPAVKTPKQEQKQMVDDSPEEKELLKKIKIQHDKQQQLLVEQEELIKKLEEHQDKKEQAAEEKRGGEARDESKVEAPAERDVQSPVLANDAGDENVVNAVPPVAQKKEMKDVDANVLARDGILPGRELLSEQNGDEVPVGEELEVQKPDSAELDSVDQLAAREKTDVLEKFDAKAAPVPADMGSEHRKNAKNQEFSFEPLPHLEQLKKDDADSDLLKNTLDVNEERAPRKIRALEDDKILMMDKDSPDRIMKQTDLEAEKVLESEEEREVKSEEDINPEKVDDSIQEEEGAPRKIRALEDDKILMMDKDSPDRIMKQTDLEAEKVLESEEEREVKSEEDINPEKVDDSIQEENSETGGDVNLVLETVKEEPLARESLSELKENEAESIEADKNQKQGQESEENDSVVDCLEDDKNCWQGKSKSRELKSVGENDL